MDEEFDSSKEAPLNFIVRLSLQKLAATALALRLWRGRFYNQIEEPPRKKIRTDSPLDALWLSGFSEWKKWDRSCLDEDKLFSCREVIVVPTRIADLIDKEIVLIGDELRIWRDKLMVLYPEIFWLGGEVDLKVMQMFSSFLNNIIFKQDRTICIRSTVTLVLKSTEVEISPTTKYKIACEFCLENCVREFWPLVNNQYVAEVVPPPSPLVVYWNNAMMNYRNGEFLGNTLISTMTYENRAAVEYFWNKLPRDTQTIRVIEIMRNADFRAMKFLLSKLNATQAERVCKEVGDFIFGKTSKKDEYFEYAMRCWIYMKDFIPGRVFCGIIRRLWLIAFNHAQSDLKTINRSGDLLHKIWITASDPLKLPVLNRNFFDDLFGSLDDQVRGVCNYDVKFMLQLLTDADYELKHNVWLKNWRKLVVRAEPLKLEELMRLCFLNVEEIEQFKDDRMANFGELEPYFSGCIEKKLISELCQYLMSCVRNPRRMENLCKEIIFSNLHTILSCDDENELAKFHSLIHCTFRDLQSANKFTKELILAPECLGFIYCKLEEGRFDEVINTVNRFPPDEKNLNEMKREFLEYCSRNLARGHITKFDGQKFENFLYWCSCSFDETTIFSFKQSLNIDDIFDIIVNKAVQEGCTSVLTQQTLLDFNNFLEWYFGCLENAKIYKSTKMFHFKESEVLKIAFRKGGPDFVEPFLKWAFDDDEVNISLVSSMWINDDETV